MKREIKFRGFNTRDNEYYYDSVSKLILYKISIEADYPTYLIIEQYTGLKDKNGVEIYEGDQFKIGGEIQTVTFSNGCYFVGAIVLAMTCGHREIIGNIHEQS